MTNEQIARANELLHNLVGLCGSSSAITAWCNELHSIINPVYYLHFYVGPQLTWVQIHSSRNKAKMETLLKMLDDDSARFELNTKPDNNEVKK